MANMFSGKNDKQIPKTLGECTQQDATAANLHYWAERLESWGKILFWVLIIIGFFSTITDTLAAADVNEDMAFVTCISTAISWALYAFIEYCAYHVLALLISSLALITQNTIISANVALYEASHCTTSIGAIPSDEDTTPSTSKPQTHINKPYTPPAAGTWVCKHCGTNNSTNYGQCKKCGIFRS